MSSHNRTMLRNGSQVSSIDIQQLVSNNLTAQELMHQKYNNVFINAVKKKTSPLLAGLANMRCFTLGASHYTKMCPCFPHLRLILPAGGYMDPFTI